MTDERYRPLLERVEKPARYTGGELNQIYKETAQVRFALCFPDVYDIGMSHLGSRILYSILNDREDTFCERVFAPWPDMERELRNSGLPLYGLESGTPLSGFDIVGFSLLYEMCYTNILTMLELGGIPLLRAQRGEDAPLVVCGGPCVCNPEPITDFVDAFLIGDGEESIGELVEVYKAARADKLSREETLARIAGIQGVFVPAFANEDTKVTRRIVRDLDHAAYVGKQLVPYMEIVHDRVAVEPMRGCIRGCRFCQAGYIYRPVRERSCGTLLKQAHELVECTGYDEVSVLSLSTGDYSQVHELVPSIIRSMEEQKVSVSLPSLRVDSLLGADLNVMRTVRKAGLTFAPEAGTQRLRDVINKNITHEDILRATGDAFEAGWSGVKLYFMLGLPTETDEDLVGIAELAKMVAAQFYAMPKEKRGKGLRLTVSVSTFVPKPFTAFQYCPQCAPEEIRRKQLVVREAMKGVRGAVLNCHASRLSVLEAAFSRGDARLNQVLLTAYRLGCRFDSWTEHFRPELWEQAFAQHGLSEAMFAQAVYTPGEKLPWSRVDMLVTEEYLQKEYARAMNAETTPDCRTRCNGCFGKIHAADCDLSQGR